MSNPTTLFHLAKLSYDLIAPTHTHVNVHNNPGWIPSFHTCIFSVIHHFRRVHDVHGHSKCQGIPPLCRANAITRTPLCPLCFLCVLCGKFNHKGHKGFTEDTKEQSNIARQTPENIRKIADKLPEQTEPQPSDCEKPEPRLDIQKKGVRIIGQFTDEGNQYARRNHRQRSNPRQSFPYSDLSEELRLDGKALGRTMAGHDCRF
jgi:hypothetical protein